MSTECTPELIARSERPAGATGHPFEVTPALISDRDDVGLGHGMRFQVFNQFYRFSKRSGKRQAAITWLAIRSPALKQNTVT